MHTFPIIYLHLNMLSSCLLFVKVMTAVKQYHETLKSAVDEGADLTLGVVPWIQESNLVNDGSTKNAMLNKTDN